MLASTHEKKTWVTDSLRVQNPYGKSWAKGKIATMEPLTMRRSSYEKYSMYLKSTNRPKTTPFNHTATPPHKSLRLYVNHAGDSVGDSLSRGVKSPAQISKINPKLASAWIKPPGTAPVHANTPIDLQQHGTIRHRGAQPLLATVLSSLNMSRERHNLGAGRKWCLENYTTGKTGNKGQSVQKSLCRQGQMLQPSSERKSKRVVSPKKEVREQKLLKEVKRSKECTRDFKPGTTVIAARKSVSSTGSSIYLSQRLGNIMTASNPFGSFSNRPTEPDRDVGGKSSTNRQTASSNAISTSNKVSPGSQGGLNGVESSLGNNAHPLHRMTVSSRQQATSRASYSQQLSTGWTSKARTYHVGPTIVSPEFDGNAVELATISGKEHCFRGGMLHRSNNTRDQEQALRIKKAPPTPSGGSFGALDLSSIPVVGDPSSLGQKWRDAKEPPRVQGWKFGQAKSQLMIEATGREEKDSDRSDLKVGGKRAETRRLRDEGETSAAEDMIHDLLSACPITPEPKGQEAASSRASSIDSRIDVDGDSAEEASARSENQDRFENGFRLLRGDYEVEEVVGEGAYGVVMKCRVRNKPGIHVAIKEFKLEDNDPDAEEVRKTMHREVKLLHDLQHRHVVRFIEHFKIAEKVFIVMEFVPMNLLEVLEAKAGCGLDKDTVRRVIYEVVSAIAFIHSKDVVYRDIKPENMLITEAGEVKLCDFGFARYVDRSDELLTDYVATRWYRAPELLLGPPFTKEGSKVQCPYGKPVDMWAIGCLMGELLDGEPLFAGDSDIDQLYRIQQILGTLMDSHAKIFERNPSNQGIVFNIKKPKSLGARYHEKADADELDFMEGLLDMDPEKRRTSEECLQHQYLLPLAKKYAS